MSYYSRVECHIEAFTQINFEDIRSAVRDWLNKQGDSLNVIENVKSSIELPFDEVGFNKLHAVEIIELYQTLSQNFPEADFYVRGVGEEFEDLIYDLDILRMVKFWLR